MKIFTLVSDERTHASFWSININKASNYFSMKNAFTYSCLFLNVSASIAILVNKQS